MKAAKEEWIEEQCKNIEKGMVSGNSKEANNTLKAVIKTQQHKSAVTKDSSRNIRIKITAVLNQWIEYCSGLCNYKLHPDPCVLQSNLTQEVESLPGLREEVEEAVHSLKAEKSPGVNNSLS